MAEKNRALPDPKEMLHGQTDCRYADPAAKSQRQRFASGSYQLDYIGVEAYAAIARTIKNLFSSLSGENTAASIPAETAAVVIIDAPTKII